jgi:glycosyltransferase involved in cell wall biosynthesis
MSIKTVHLTNYYHRESGGISTAYNKLLEAAERHRRYVRLIVPGEESKTEDVSEFGRIYYVKAGYSPLFDKRYRILLPWNTYIFDQSPIKKILRDEKPDVIEIGEKYTLSLMAGLIRKGIMNVSHPRPMLVHYSCERMDDNLRAFVSEGRLARGFARSVMRNYIFPMFDFHLANSEYTANELREAGKASPARERFRESIWRVLRTPEQPAGERIFVNQCGVELGTLSPGRRSAEARRALCSRYAIPASAILLLYAGRISPEKNVSLLPEVAGALSKNSSLDFRFLVAGGGPDSQRLAERFESLAPGKAHLLGHVTDSQELAQLFANCDVFVHPNPREPFGITPLEAMASGLPLVAPNSGGVLSYASDANAWLCEPYADSFAAAISDICSEPERRAQRVTKALETAESYDWPSSTTNLFAIYDRMFEEFQRHRMAFTHEASPDIHLSESPVSHI